MLKTKTGEFIVEKERKNKGCWGEGFARKRTEGRGGGNERVKKWPLTFFGVARRVLAGVAHHPVEVSGPVLQHVIPGRQKVHIIGLQKTWYRCVYDTRPT